MTPSSPFWSAIDAIVVINLDHRADRWAAMQAHLAPVAPMEKVHRLSAVRGVDLPGYGDKRWFGRTKRPTTWAGRAGCTLSHRNALRLMRDKGWQRMLILEDDALFAAPVAQAQAAALAGFLRASEAQPAVCFLGFTEPRPPVARALDLGAGSGVFGIGGCLTTHAYVVNAPACDALLREFPEEDVGIWPWLARHNAIDAWYALRLAGLCAVTAVSPAWVEQEDSVSDITNRQGGTAQAAAPLVEGGSACGAGLARALGAPGRFLKWRLRLCRGF